MHAVHLNLLPAPVGGTLDALIVQWPSLAMIAEAVAVAGARVTVLQAAASNDTLTQRGVDYRFVDIAGANDARSRGDRFVEAIAALDADVIHLHGLGFAEQAYPIARRLTGLPWLLQDHADRAPPWWQRRRHRRFLAIADAYVFTATALAGPFVAAGLLSRSARLVAIPEATSTFEPGPRAVAREETALHGSPCLLWIGHLVAGKDPVTVLDGLALALDHLPDAQLWCAFGTAPLRADVERRILDDARLRGRVHLIGPVPHARIERLLQAADIFVSGSLTESCGYAVLEALACGVPCVVTDIPAHRALVGSTRVGALWPAGNAAACAEALVAVAHAPPTTAQVRARFDDALSARAVGHQWLAAYTQAARDRIARAS